MTRKLAIEIISFLFILLFLYASFSKILDYQKFMVQIGQSPLLTGFGGSVPWMVIAAEILTSILLALPRFRLIGFFAAFSLMVMFTAYIIAILNFGSYVPCSCGGVLEKLGWTEHLIFNAAFVFLGLLGIILQAAETKAQKAAPLTSILFLILLYIPYRSPITIHRLPITDHRLPLTQTPALPTPTYE